MSEKIVAIVPAGGVGLRALDCGGPESGAIPKQYRLLGGEPMLRVAVRALLADKRIAEVRVAVAPGDAWAEQALAGLPRTVWRPCGGATRADTVMAALLDAALEPDDWALVHDAARPGLPASALGRLIDHCLAMGRGGLLAQPVADTVKRQQPLDSSLGTLVQQSISRDGLWLAQTPQMFPAGLLLQALQLLQRAAITDEASAMEHTGYTPCLVPGSARNFKVTWPEDFELMEKWL